MRYIELKRRKVYGNCSWRRTIYTGLTGGESIRDALIQFRDYDTTTERKKYKMWIKNKLTYEQTFTPTLYDKRTRKMRLS